MLYVTDWALVLLLRPALHGYSGCNGVMRVGFFLIAIAGMVGILASLFSHNLERANLSVPIGVIGGMVILVGLFLPKPRAS